jgi:hypothetical protein
VPTTAFAAGEEITMGIAVSNPISKVETERSEVNLLNIGFNQVLPSLSARKLCKSLSKNTRSSHL